MAGWQIYCPNTRQVWHLRLLQVARADQFKSRVYLMGLSDDYLYLYVTMYIYPYPDTFKTFATDFHRRPNCNKQYIDKDTMYR